MDFARRAPKGDGGGKSALANAATQEAVREQLLEIAAQFERLA